MKIIGTSHIAKESINEITTTIAKEKPDIVAVELDKQRLVSLIQQKKTKFSLQHVRHIGVKGYLFALVGQYLQQKLGKIVGVTPGSDMLAAVQAAKKNKSRLALIDQDINITLQKFSRSFTWKEKWHLAVDIFRGIFFQKRELKRLGINNLDLSKVPTSKLIEKLLDQMKLRYPNLYRTLVFERNHVMANNLHKLQLKYPNETIIAVVGAGHEAELIRLVQKYKEGKIDTVAL